MIVLPKATKGRRMSKKTRKKSPKTSSGKVIRAASKISAKTPPEKSRKATAKKSGKSAGITSAKTSHKPPSKPLKSAPRPSASTQAANPPAKKPPVAKTGAAPRQPGLTEGVKAPAFRLPRDGGDTVSLSDYAGKKLVLFFYPRADTPGCTREAIDFTRLRSAFVESRTAVLGVSADSPKAQESFRDKHDLAVPLISDERHEMLEAYGAWGEKSMYGRTFQGILRTTVLIGADGRIAKIWRHVKVDGHADAVLEAARSL
jgi:thioredoxin-dependent peroxiredoxin